VRAQSVLIALALCDLPTGTDASRRYLVTDVRLIPVGGAGSLSFFWQVL
jgi:hypothetical protein